jgi:hypothetical protein
MEPARKNAVLQLAGSEPIQNGLRQAFKVATDTPAEITELLERLRKNEAVCREPSQIGRADIALQNRPPRRAR